MHQFSTVETSGAVLRGTSSISRHNGSPVAKASLDAAQALMDSSRRDGVRRRALTLQQK